MHTRRRADIKSSLWGFASIGKLPCKSDRTLQGDLMELGSTLTSTMTL